MANDSHAAHGADGDPTGPPAEQPSPGDTTPSPVDEAEQTPRHRGTDRPDDHGGKRYEPL